MILIGDKLVPFENISKINQINEIENTKSNSTLSFGYNEDLLKYTYENELNSAVKVNSIKEAIYANALNAKYILAQKSLAKQIQKVAENYMFDSKVLAIIESNEELEEIATFEIDGIIYNSIIE
ncbi:hypothetical protein [Arcobacter roscoffensis]|uniref:Uncharacterized protein n=1 Tax=Arcobacter roscoffensis TaxID=2961520 RepID=A0ABY5DYY1_9BACT|nr:hypothetical protein [Arcobacter roscoffensis]MAC82588.1 hypothetical protein [Arcobacter sp.]UTJ05164.1 hypothetical protein NJU99_07730 [Arcobacter roscoffensis]|tara:strand:- start:1367 stop:1738 length:372 start_codon:yes stop_codon:yes gene_type:complete